MVPHQVWKFRSCPRLSFENHIASLLIFSIIYSQRTQNSNTRSTRMVSQVQHAPVLRFGEAASLASRPHVRVSAYPESCAEISRIPRVRISTCLRIFVGSMLARRMYVARTSGRPIFSPDLTSEHPRAPWGSSGGLRDAVLGQHTPLVTR